MMLFPSLAGAPLSYVFGAAAPTVGILSNSSVAGLLRSDVSSFPIDDEAQQPTEAKGSLSGQTVVTYSEEVLSRMVVPQFIPRPATTTQETRMQKRVSKETSTREVGASPIPKTLKLIFRGSVVGTLGGDYGIKTRYPCRVYVGSDGESLVVEPPRCAAQRCMPDGSVAYTLYPDQDPETFLDDCSCWWRWGLCEPGRVEYIATHDDCRIRIIQASHLTSGDRLSFDCDGSSQIACFGSMAIPPSVRVVSVTTRADSRVRLSMFGVSVSLRSEGNSNIVVDQFNALSRTTLQCMAAGTSSIEFEGTASTVSVRTSGASRVALVPTSGGLDVDVACSGLSRLSLNTGSCSGFVKGAVSDSSRVEIHTRRDSDVCVVTPTDFNRYACAAPSSQPLSLVGSPLTVSLLETSPLASVCFSSDGATVDPPVCKEYDEYDESI